MERKTLKDQYAKGMITEIPDLTPPPRVEAQAVPKLAPVMESSPAAAEMSMSVNPVSDGVPDAPTLIPDGIPDPPTPTNMKEQA